MVNAVAASRGVNASRAPPEAARATSASRAPPSMAIRAVNANRGMARVLVAAPIGSKQRPQRLRRPCPHSLRACLRSVVRNRGAPSAKLSRSLPITRIFRRSCCGRYAPASEPARDAPDGRTRGRRPPHGEPVLNRAFRILTAFRPGDRSLPLASLSARSGLPAPTTLRLARKLVELGALERDEDGRYVIGLRLLEIANRTEVPVYPGAVFPLVSTQARVKRWEALYGKLFYNGAWTEKWPEEGAVRRKNKRQDRLPDPLDREQELSMVRIPDADR